MKKLITRTVLFFLLSLCVFAENVRIATLAGPTAIPLAFFLEEKKVPASFEQFSSPQLAVPKLLKGEIDIAFLPPNLAAKVYNSSAKNLQVLGLSGNGNLFLISKDKTISSFADLAGKTIYVAGKGATPEYVFRTLLKKNNVKNVTLDFSIASQNLAAMLIENKITYALVPEPFASLATLKSTEVFRTIDVQKEFAKIFSDKKNYPLSLVVVRKEFAEKNKSLVKKIVKAFSSAITKTNENPKKAGELCEKYSLGLAPAVVEKAIPYANFTWQNAKDAKSEIENLLLIFLQFDADSIGGKLPDEKFYFK